MPLALWLAPSERKLRAFAFWPKEVRFTRMGVEASKGMANLKEVQSTSTARCELKFESKRHYITLLKAHMRRA